MPKETKLSNAHLLIALEINRQRRITNKSAIETASNLEAADVELMKLEQPREYKQRFAIETING